MKRRFYSAVLCSSLILTLSGCSSGAGSETSDTNASDGTEESVEVTEETSSVSGVFATLSGKEYEIVTPSTDLSYTVNSDLSNVINGSNYYFSDEQLAKLVENGFFVTDGYQSEFYMMYESNRYSYTPNFVTTDSMLHTYHLFFSYLMKNVEKDYLSGELLDVSNTMLEASKAQYEALKGTEWENAAARNVAYFTIGSSLLGGDPVIESYVSDIVNSELSLIAQQSGIYESPLMLWNNETENPLKEDYSQYIVRGYYTENETLSNYFRGMMWYGRITFRVSSEEESRSAALMSVAAKEYGALDGYDEIYEITSYFMGNSDDPGINEYNAKINASTTDELISGDWSSAYENLKTIEAPKINSIPVFEDEDEDSAEIGFRFMGQRTTFDAEAMQQLVYDNIGENESGEYRYLPSTLDIAAVFGSDTAKEELQNNGTYSYEGYEENLAKLESGVESADSAIWNATVYNGWLNMIRPLTESHEGNTNYPTFMQSNAWSYKQLNTFAGSFAELKHDTVLYSKQVYAEMGADGFEEVDDRGYVEPQPAVFARLANVAEITKEGLASFGMLSESDSANLDRLVSLSEQLLTISNKELRGEGLTDEEYDLIRTYGGQLEHFWYETLSDEEKQNAYYSPDNHPSAIITDIATDPNGSVLEIGTGRVDTIYVVVNVEGSLRIAEGTVYSYYEFEQPIDERMTDQQWWVQLGLDYETNADGSVNWNTERKDIEQPEWVNNFKAGY